MTDDFFHDFICPHCERLTSFEEVAGSLHIGYREWTPDGTTYYSQDLSAVTFHCQNPVCGGKLLVLQDGDSVTRLLWPATAPRSLPVETPAQVRDAYREASQCQSISAMRAAGVMYRMTLELICDELSIPRDGSNSEGRSYRSLANRVPDLESKGLSRELVDDMQEVRLVGNDSVHEGVEFAENELADIRHLIDEAVEILFVQPVRKASMRAARQARRDAKNGIAAPGPL